MFLSFLLFIHPVFLWQNSFRRIPLVCLENKSYFHNIASRSVSCYVMVLNHYIFFDKYHSLPSTLILSPSFCAESTAVPSSGRISVFSLKNVFHKWPRVHGPHRVCVPLRSVLNVCHRHTAPLTGFSIAPDGRESIIIRGQRHRMDVPTHPFPVHALPLPAFCVFKGVF